MEPYMIVISIVFLAAIITVIVLWKKSSHKHGPDIEYSEEDISLSRSADSSFAQRSEVTIQFKDLTALSESEEARLVEIKDQKLLARIDNVIPGALQAVANAGAVNRYQQAVKKAGQLYQAIIPKGAVLADSKAMEGAVRGIYHGADGIAGHANLVAVNGNLGGGLAAMSVANAAMGAASMVVGQYYMTQINDQLGEINSELDKIATFQDKEYQSRIYALVAAIQKCSQFQYEIIENEEQRKLELIHLTNLEDECARLLGQANLTIKEFEKKSELDYSRYEKDISRAQTWCQYQTILLEIMRKIEELAYALNLGKVSKESCYSMILPYAEQADEALKALKNWHDKTGKALEIDLEARRRRRQGLEGLFMNIPALLNDGLRYRDVSKRTAAMISRQSSGQTAATIKDTVDLFQEDVRLIAKDGKLYYLPEGKASSE